MKEIRALTALRALAAFLVFMYHYAFLFPPASRGVAVTESVPLLAVWRSGQVGVSIFFVLSGFLITRIYYDDFARGTARLRLYFVKRIARIWPLFLLLTAVQHGVQLLSGGHPDATWFVTWSMTQGFFHDLRYAGLPTAWSLTIEESFYALAPLLCVAIAVLAFGRSRSEAVRAPLLRVAAALGVLCIGVAAAFSLLMLFGRLIGFTFGGFMQDTSHLLHATLGGRFPEFAVGMGCAFLHRTGRLPHWLSGSRASALALTAFVAITLGMAGKDFANARGWQIQSFVLTYVITLAAGALILALSVERSLVSRALSGRLAVYLGKVSYGFYLIQLTVVMTPLLALTDRLGYWRLPVLCVLMNVVCAVLYEVVERPARRAIIARFGGAGARSD